MNDTIIVKRGGAHQNVSFVKIFKRIEKLCRRHPPLENIECYNLSADIMENLGEKMTSQQVDTLIAEHTAQMTIVHPDYGKLAARITTSNIHKRTEKWASFSATTQKLKDATHPSTGRICSVINENYYNNVMNNAKRLDAAINYELDYSYSYIGLQTLERSYLIKISVANNDNYNSNKDGEENNNSILIERPQNMLMRTAVGIHGSDVEAAIETYRLMASQVFTHASPTLFNSGTKRSQLSSCFLMGLQEDSLDGIFGGTLVDAVKISDTAGGIGLHIHNMRARGSAISSWGGSHPGVMAFLKVFNSTMKCVSQGGNKRRGSMAVYVPMWHADIMDVIECRKNNGNELLRTRELFPAVWVPDLFMERVEKDQTWTLMCPHECPGLSDVYGKEFKELYESYERKGKGRETIKARDLMDYISTTKLETGTPFICFKDTINAKSNHSNIGTIKSSNLCTEIVQYSDDKQTAVCNLASVAVNKFIRQCPIPSLKNYYDFEELKRVVKVITRNLDKIIDVTYYPTEKAKLSNTLTRPMGLGVQGLADLFIAMRLPFDSKEASLLNKRIFETIYFAALEASCEMAMENGPYPKYEGSPISRGILQFDMGQNINKSQMIHNWDALKRKIKKYGVRNSMFVAPMPTASTAQILGNAETTEPYTSNVFNRNILSGSCQVVNEALVQDLMKLGMWTETVKDLIIRDGGSVQNLDIPKEVKDLYKTSWEVKQKVLMDMAADRGIFVDQAQSLNLYIEKPSVYKYNKCIMYCWKLGIKTMYYLRTKAAVKPPSFTIDTPVNSLDSERNVREDCGNDNNKAVVCSSQNPDACELCSG